MRGDGRQRSCKHGSQPDVCTHSGGRDVVRRLRRTCPLVEGFDKKLEPLAKEGLSLTTTVRDHRNGLYRTLMYVALTRNDQAQAADWGDRRLKDLDGIKPANDEERSAVDSARVENIQAFGDPKRILPALLTSEHAWRSLGKLMQRPSKRATEAFLEHQVRLDDHGFYKPKPTL